MFQIDFDQRKQAIRVHNKSYLKMTQLNVEKTKHICHNYQKFYTACLKPSFSL